MHDDPRILERVKSHRWDEVRDAFLAMHRFLLSMDDSITAKLTTIYAKYQCSTEPMSPVFAVVWLKKSKQIDVGLAMPDDSVPASLKSATPAYRYAPLNAFFRITPGDSVPPAFEEWAQAAYEHRRVQPF